MGEHDEEFRQQVLDRKCEVLEILHQEAAELLRVKIAERDKTLSDHKALSQEVEYLNRLCGRLEMAEYEYRTEDLMKSRRDGPSSS